jgi:hypothetical protein
MRCLISLIILIVMASKGFAIEYSPSLIHPPENTQYRGYIAYPSSGVAATVPQGGGGSTQLTTIINPKTKPVFVPSRTWSEYQRFRTWMQSQGGSA